MNQTLRTSVACPYCQVAPGEPCMGAGGKPRLTVHVERWQKRLVSRRKRAAKDHVKEGDIRDLLKARVTAYGGEVRAVSWLGRKNAPDVLCLFPQHIRDPVAPPTFVETKRPGKDATVAQAREHGRMRDAGCVVLMIRDEQELDAWLPPL